MSPENKRFFAWATVIVAMIALAAYVLSVLTWS